MNTVIAYVEPDGLKYVKLDKDITLLSAENLVSDESKLSKVLSKQKERDNTVIGVIVTDKVLIKLQDDMKFTGIVWAGGSKLSGRFEFI